MRTCLALVAVLGGCTTGAGPAAYVPPVPTTVEVVEKDHGYVLDRREVPAGRTVFHMLNRSNLNHNLSLVALPHDTPPISEQLRGDKRVAVSSVARLPSRVPGSREAFAVDLTPGRYALLCWERDGTGVAHATMGMAVELRVIGAGKRRMGG